MNHTVISKVLLIARCCLFCCLALTVQAGQTAENGGAQAAQKKPPVFTKHGNIFYADGKKTIQLTHSGKDDNPVLSPNGKPVVFVRETTRESSAPYDGNAWQQGL